MPENSPVLSPVRLIELRSFAPWSSSYLQRALDTTYAPEPERVTGAVRDLRGLGLALPESPRVDGASVTAGTRDAPVRAPPPLHYQCRGASRTHGQTPASRCTRPSR